VIDVGLKRGGAVKRATPPVHRICNIDGAHAGGMIAGLPYGVGEDAFHAVSPIAPRGRITVQTLDPTDTVASSSLPVDGSTIMASA
jgi:hypothetical protein